MIVHAMTFIDFAFEVNFSTRFSGSVADPGRLPPKPSALPANSTSKNRPHVSVLAVAGQAVSVAQPLTFPTEFPLDTTYCIAPTYGFLLDDAGRSPYP